MRTFFAISLVLLLAVGTVIVLWEGEPSHVNNTNKNKTSGNKNVDFNESTVEASSPSALATVATDNSSHVKVEEGEKLSCHQKYQQQPEWKEIEDILSTIYTSGEEAAGQGIYQRMPIETLQSYAESGNPKAMFHYGSALMWKGSVGIYLNYPGEVERIINADSYKNKHRHHKPDLEVINLGSDYLYKSAVKGRLGAFMETAFTQQATVRRMNRDGFDFSEEQKLTLLARSMANFKVMEYVHHNDEFLAEIVDYEYFTSKLLDELYPEKEHKEEVLKKLNSQVTLIYQTQKSQWISDRNYHGLPAQPKLFNRRLERFYIEHIKVCE